MAGKLGLSQRLLSVSGLGARTLLRRVAPLVTLAGAVVATSILLPSLPAANPNVAQAGGGLAGLSPSFGATPSAGPSATPSGPGGAFGPGTAPLNGAVSSNYNSYLAAAGVPCNTYQGVHCDHIDIVYHYPKSGQPCPQSQDLSQLLGALGADQDPNAVVPILADYFNSHVADFFPNGHQFLGNVPAFYGRKIRVIPETDGGTFCDGVTQQTATKIATTDLAFGAIGGCLTCNNEGAPRAMQPALAQYHLISVENSQFLKSWYDPLAPYAWSPISSADQIVSNLSDIVCHYLNSRPPISPNPAGYPPYASQHRVFSTAHVDEDQENEMAAMLDHNIESCIPGGNPDDPDPKDGRHGQYWGTDFAYAPDPSTSGRQAATYSTTMQSKFTTTVVSLADPVASQVGLGADAANQWKHESIVSDFIFLDSDQSGEASAGPEQPYIISTSEGDDIVQSTWRWEDTWYAKAWIQAHGGSYTGSNHPPTDLRLWAIDMELLAYQLMVAGPNLNPQNIQSGMFRYCAPCPRESGPYSPLPAYGPGYATGSYTGAKDYSLAIFDPSKHSEYVQMAAQTAKAYTAGNGAFEPLTDYSTVPGSNTPLPAGQFKDLGNLGWMRFLSWLVPG